MPEPSRPSEEHGPWVRKVTRRVESPTGAMTVERSETLDMREAAKRLREVIHERPDAGVMAWLDCALNGWGDEDDR